MPGYVRDDTPPEEVARQRELYGPFTQAVRELADATIRTTVDDDEIRRVRAEVEALTARLRASQIDGAYGVRFGRDGEGRPWGNAVMGLRNPIAPPLVVEQGPPGSGEAWSEFTLGAAYEGPPGMVHGGVTSLILDQLLGQAVAAGGRPGMTGTLTVVYRQPTPLGRLRVQARLTRVDGVKTWATGEMVGPDGVTVEAEGVFILPRWAREAIAERAEGGEAPPTYFE